MEGPYKGRPERRARHIAGMCVDCGIVPARTGRKYCLQCALRRAGYQAKRAERLKAAGICRQCGKNPCMPSPVHEGKLGCLCERCHEMRLEGIRIKREKRNAVLQESAAE